jgi:AcrR family transcriptional regulator
MRLNTQQRQRQIIDTAINIIHHHGYSQLSIRELADQVGISQPALYRHFTNKDAIILGILDRMMQLGTSIKQKLEAINDPKEKIKQFILGHIEFLQENPEMTSVVFSEDIFQDNAQAKIKLKTILNFRCQILTEIITESKQNGLVVDIRPQDLSMLIIGFLRLAILNWRLNNFQDSLKDRVNQMIETIEKLIFI